MAHQTSLHARGCNLGIGDDSPLDHWVQAPRVDNRLIEC